MYDKNTLNTLSESVKTTLYVYERQSGRLSYFSGGEEKETAAPAWIVSMAENGPVRKLFQKDGKASAYYCFDTGGGKYIIFQDNPEGEKLGLFIKALSNSGGVEKAPAESQEAPNIKKELIRVKSEQARLAVESKQKDSLISELKARLESSRASDTESMRRTINELKEVNASQLSQIRRMKADTDHTNFQKLKQVNAELREEISGITYKAAEAEERSGKIRKILQNTVTELTRLLEASQIDKNDIKRLMSKIPSAELGETGPSLTGVKADIGRQQPSAPSKGRQPDITDIINTLNAVIAKNDVSGINIDKLASVVPISDKEGIKRNPAAALKSVIGTLIGMSKASRLSPLQINTLCDALGIR